MAGLEVQGRHRDQGEEDDDEVHREEADDDGQDGTQDGWHVNEDSAAARKAVSAGGGNLLASSRVNILFVGDVFGSAGRHIVREHLPQLVESHAVDLLVVNGENAAGGFGITPSIAEEIFDLGAHVITTGNHIWDKKEIFEYMTVPSTSHERGRRIIRPANYAVTTPGFGDV